MGKQKTKTEIAREQRAHLQRRRFLIMGVLSVALLAGLATWYFFPRQSPLRAASQYHGGPRLAVQTDLIDFGPVHFEKMVEARFLVRNVGDQPLQIAANPPVEVVEGCWPPRAVVGSTTLLPGQETEVSTAFTMHEGMGGPHLFEIQLRTNDVVEPARILKIRSLWQR
jgi:hypothetical protein